MSKIVSYHLWHFKFSGFYFLLLQNEEIDCFGFLKSFTALSSSDSEFNKSRLSMVTVPQNTSLNIW